ncbi:MAG TPA: helix-turn-helix domain-containing protein, partial [Sphingomonas sp.]|nr:helix-turn-helix domain-containing protein [Sphingomonas sp.]
KIPADSPAFQRSLLEQLYYRSFDQAVVFRVVDGKQVEAMLARHGGNQLRAARALGINRNTLRKRLDTLGIDVGPNRPDGAE